MGVPHTLPEIDEAGVGIIFEVPFGPGTEPHELRIVRTRKSKLAGSPSFAPDKFFRSLKIAEI